VLLVGCRQDLSQSPGRRPTAQTLPDEFSIMTYNLRHYSLEDRDGDGLPSEPKPLTEREAVVDLVARWRPDILAVQEIGSEVFQEFRRLLRTRGLEYPWSELLVRPGSRIGLAVLTRFPITHRQPRLDQTYRIGTNELYVLRGFLDVEIQIREDYRLRLVVAHLKSKVFHPMGQTEMRRNEARLLHAVVSELLNARSNLNLLVVGDLNDTPDSAPIRRLTSEDEPRLYDLRPADEWGDVWTYFHRASDTYSRIDYALASAGILPEFVRERSRAVRDPGVYRASDHRPLFLVFKARELAPSGGNPPR